MSTYFANGNSFAMRPKGKYMAKSLKTLENEKVHCLFKYHLSFWLVLCYIRIA